MSTVSETRSNAPPARIAAWILALIGLFLILRLGLLSAVLAGLLVFQLIHVLAPLVDRKVRGRRARLIAVALLAILIIGFLTLATLGLIAFFRADTGGEQALLARLMDVIDASRNQVPLWAQPYLPDDMSDLKRGLNAWLDEHRGELSLVGAEAAQLSARLLVGMVLGAMIALQEELPALHLGPLGQELLARVSRLSDAFRRVVFAQIKISALNTAFTAVFLLIVLPLFGIHVPMAKTLIVVTFIAGLLPVVGNLISNTLITIAALSVSIYVAITALVYLVLIHKLEYFLNARIVGGEIKARAWELLLAMLMMEAAFGIPGLIAGPIYYAYIKRELVDQSWI
ncbi:MULTISPECIES: AI-2E family transporter [unclassified Lysobacter]|uniref:AI-2E family transporter n=1 Tax=unclassified Lysobacter TaxID=2635362 RepID=UPI001BE9DB33|nr:MULTISPECIES: AI-2E family transporter [unclassified Lysobacter]MBT2745528.1 AI-2E family transporter [Lysobacter sp. ISL-42]MBT2753467.1 AI-2E family transporter [Lysobacter sp. ISL-50]MBT2777149.1 AI-2E family transporter [Lysobacter sp. ISL-54]MBT2780225.1 AI-2E family transporter [Lysobacter sp. ISL-52]